MKKLLCLFLIAIFFIIPSYAENDTYGRGSYSEEEGSDIPYYEFEDFFESNDVMPDDMIYDAVDNTDAYTPNETLENVDKITVYLDGMIVKFDVEPIIINSRTMVPVRAIFEALGAVVSWDGITSTATGTLGDTTVKITIGESRLFKNGEEKAIDSPAVIIDGRTLVPARAIAECFDCTVNWDGASKIVDIRSIALN